MIFINVNVLYPILDLEKSYFLKFFKQFLLKIHNFMKIDKIQ